MANLDGRVALVTGGGQGIGRAVAILLAGRGARVVVMGPEERGVGETVGEIVYGGGKARHLAGDVRDPAHVAAAVARAVDTFGGLDIVVSTAAPTGRVALGADLERASAILATNLVGAYHAFHAAVPSMKGPGRLLAATAVTAPLEGGGHGARAAAEAGLVGLVRAVAHEVAPKRITCNAILPGPGDPEAVEAHVADAVVFLCSRAGDGITGQALAIGAGGL